MSEKIKILVAAHKPDPNIRQDEVYMPIHVGKALHPELELGFQGDNTGDNISEKNGSYCELTAIYWAWKNFKNVDIIGLAHYRRYFDTSIKDIIRNVQKKKIIVSKYYTAPCSNLEHLTSFIGREDVYIMLDTVLELYPDFRKEVIDYFYNSNKYSVFNMIVAEKRIFDEYCEFIFPLLDKIQQRLIPGSYSRQRRNLGYMAEALMGLWIKLSNHKVKKVDTIIMGKKNNKFKIHVQNALRNIAFRLIHLRKEKKVDTYDAVIAGLKIDGITLESIH